MNRKISICIIVFIAILAVGLPAAVLSGKSKTDAPENGTLQTEEVPDSQKQERSVVVSSDNTVTYVFVLHERDGRVVVCRPGSENIYMETGILADELPAEIKERLTGGIGFVSEELLFEFLESYSS